MREQPPFLEHVADPAPVPRHEDAARRVDQDVTPSIVTRPCVRPDQPGDDVDDRGLAGARRPNSAVRPPPVSKRASSGKLAEPVPDVDGQRHSISRRRLARRASSSEASSASIEIADRDEGEAQRAGVAARHLREGVDRRRQRLRLARNVGDEGDGGAELAHRLGEAQDHAGDDAGQRSAAG